MRVEADLQKAFKRAERAESDAARSTAVSEELRTRNAELATTLEALQCRLADLETESGIYAVELQRLEADRANESEHRSTLQADFARQSEAELAAWQEIAAQREADLVAARDEVARRLELEESQSLQLSARGDELAAQLCAAQAQAYDAAQEALRLQQEIDAGREEREREPTIFENAARQREAELQISTDSLHASFEDELQQHQARIDTLEAQLSEVRSECDGLRSARQATKRHVAELHDKLEGLQGQSMSILQSQEAMGSHIGALQSAKMELIARGEALSLTVRQLEVERSALREAYDKAAQQEASGRADNERLQEQCGALQTLLAEAQSRVGELEETNRELCQPPNPAIAAETDRERAELRLQVEKLSAVIRQLGCEREEARADRNDAQQGLTARIDELMSERQGLQLRLAELETLTAQLERDCDRLRRERASADDLRRFKGDVVRLEAKLEEMERLRTEAAHNHSAAVAGYMVELNQRSEGLHEREIALQRANEELVEIRQACDDAVAQLQVNRQERSELERQLDELRKAAASARPSADAGLRLAATAAPAGPATAVPAASSKTSDAPRTPAAAKPAAVQVAHASVTSSAAMRALTWNGPLTVIHIDENKEVRERIRQIVGQIPSSHYLNTMDVERGKPNGTQLLAVNLLNRVHDPLAAITAAVVGSVDEQRIFAYCAEGNAGFTFGDVSFFTQPFDTDACVTWLMQAHDVVQRLLAASSNIEMGSSLRTALTHIRCSTSVALDLRQVMDLIPMTQPDAMLIDLALPRAEGLRLVSRLRGDPKTRAMPLGILLPEQAKLTELRQHAPRAAREGAITAEQIAAAFCEHIGIQVPTVESGGKPVAQVG